MTATVMVASWWGTVVRLRRYSCQLHWVLLAYVLIDLLLVAVHSADPLTCILYTANLLIAACGGASAFTVLELLRERLGLEPGPDSGT
jgi:hypothetical protein